MDRLHVQEEYLMHRFFADPERRTEDGVYLSAEDARHAATVLRLRPGQQVQVFLDGQLLDTEIISSDAKDVLVRILSVLPSTEPALSVTLFQGLPKSDKMDLIVQKATELGVSRIVPLIMERCVSRPDLKDADRKTERWRKIAREAAKQSCRCAVPEIASPVSLRGLPDLPGLPETNIVPWEEAGSYGPLAFRNSHPSLSSLGILIGPEGGIDAEEIAFLKSAGFIPLTLGKRILRTETAGLAAVAAFMSLYGEME